MWFLKLYFGFICFGIVFFSSPLQVLSLSLSLSLSLTVSVWFLFELILDYFGSKNLSLYKNTILTVLIIDQHSVHFILFWPLYLFCSIRFTLIHFGLPQSTSVQLGSFGQFSLFVLFDSLWAILVHFSQFGPIQLIRSIQSTSVYLIHLGLLGPLRPIWSISNHFGPIWCTYLRMGKYKFEFIVLSIIWVILIVIIW